MSADNGEPAIDLQHVEKTYRGKVHALRGVALRVNRGEIFGLLGPNGAGKSTLVKILMTVVRPSRIRGELLGHPVGHKPTLSRVGYLPEHLRFPQYLTGRQALYFYASLAKVDRATRRRRAGELLQLVGMSDWAERKVSSYSKGMLQRVGLAQSLMNDPDLIVLDEPTDGVDPVGRREIRDVLLSLRRQGKTIFLNSHLLSEVEMICDRVAILVQGQVVQQGKIDELTADSRRYEIIIEGKVPNAISSEFEAVRVESADTGRSRLILPNAEARSIQSVLDRLRKDEITIVSVQPVRESLEELFMRAVAKSSESAHGSVGAPLKTSRHREQPLGAAT